MPRNHKEENKADRPMRALKSQKFWLDSDVTLIVHNYNGHFVEYKDCYRIEYGYGMVEIYFRKSDTQAGAVAVPLRDVSQIEYIFPAEEPPPNETLKPGIDGSLFGPDTPNNFC